MSGSILSGPVPVFQKTVTGYRAVTTFVNDTLERIADRELNDASRWYDLVAINGLQPPWITNNPAQRIAGQVILLGQDSLLVPSTAPQATGVAQAPDVFGVDCLLNNGQIFANAQGDVATVSGLNNLQQALELRLGVPDRELVYHPTYGNRAFRLLGQANTPAADQLAASWIVAAMRADPRVAAGQITATTTGNVLAASGTATAVNGKRLPIGTPGAAL